MKKVLVAVLLVFGVSMLGSAFACDGKAKNKAMTSGTSPATPIIATATPK